SKNSYEPWDEAEQPSGSPSRPSGCDNRFFRTRAIPSHLDQERARTDMTHLIEPHGGVLVDPIVDEERAAELKKQSSDWPSWDLTERQICDLELIQSGGFSPLRGFMGKADYERVRAEMRLADGTLWPIPIALDL